MSPPAPPLAVDLDGTLLATDLLFDSLWAFVKHNPLNFIRAVMWLLRHDRAYMKARIAERVDLDIASLPYHSELLEWLRGQHQQGRKLYIATASHQKYANQIAQHLGLFEGVFASNKGPNLKGHNKAEYLANRFGPKGFDYAGDATVDLNVWSHARKAVVVSDSVELIEAASQMVEIDCVFKPEERKANRFNRLLFRLWALALH